MQNKVRNVLEYKHVLSLFTSVTQYKLNKEVEFIRVVMVAWRYQICVIKSKAGPSGAERSAGESTMLNSPKHFAANKLRKILQSQVLRSAFSEHQELAVLCRDE